VEPRSVAAVEQAGEILFAGTLGVLALLAWRVPVRRRRRALVVGFAALWLIAVAIFSSVLESEHSDVGPPSVACPVPGDDSSTSPSRWSWIPPGEVCELPAGDVGPTDLRIPFAGALLVIPVALIVAWPRRPRGVDAGVNRPDTGPPVGRHSS
jgi:hypothetical protein